MQFSVKFFFPNCVFLSLDSNIDKFIPIHDRIELDYVVGIDNFTAMKSQCLLPTIIWFSPV